jgi:hypothetical protein
VIEPAEDGDGATLQAPIRAKKLCHVRQLGGSNLIDACDPILAGIGNGHAKQFAVSMAAIDQVQTTDRPGTD